MGSAMSFLQPVATIACYVIAALYIINIHSFPLVWHVRFWWRLITARIDIQRRGIKGHIAGLFSTSASHGGVARRVVQRRRALPDDCDYNLHMSNSCYAKNSDISRSQWVFALMGPVILSGGYLALGANHYTFVHEIPFLGAYEMETRMLGFGDKWMYVVTEFLIEPSKRTRSARGARKSVRPPSGPPTPPSAAMPTLAATPEEFAAGSGAGAGAAPTASALSSALATTATAAATATDLPSVLASLRTMPPRADGKVVAAYGIVEMCFKIKRITVPPRIALHICGHSPSPTERARAFALTLDKRAADKWLMGGWRDAPDADAIGRDIDPATPLLFADPDVKHGAGAAHGPASALNAQVAASMELAAAGLAEAVLA